MKKENFEIYLNDDGFVEIGMQKMVDIMRDLGFDKTSVVTVTTDKGYVAIKQLKTFSFTESKLTDFLWEFAEEALKCKYPEDTEKLIERTINDQDN